MNIELRIVDEYPEELYQELIERNLQSNHIFIPPNEYKGAGDESYVQEGFSLKIAAYDGDKLIALSW